MNAAQKKDTLKAIGKLINHYGNYEQDAVPRGYWLATKLDCPLCLNDSHYNIDNGECGACPWAFIDDTICNDERYERDTTSQRLERLNRWKTIIEGR